MAALALVKTQTSSTLYAVEEHLNCLLECESTITPEQEAEFVRDLAAALSQAVDKRDKLGQFLAHLESQANFAKAEQDRLAARRKMFERAMEQVEGYVLRVMESLDVKKLEGQTVTLSVRNCPPSVELRDELAVPALYKRISLTLPAALYDQVLDALDIETAAQLMDAGGAFSVDKPAVKAAITAGREVPGAIVTRGKSLVRK